MVADNVYVKCVDCGVPLVRKAHVILKPGQEMRCYKCYRNTECIGERWWVAVDREKHAEKRSRDVKLYKGNPLFRDATEREHVIIIKEADFKALIAFHEKTPGQPAHLVLESLMPED